MDLARLTARSKDEGAKHGAWSGARGRKAQGAQREAQSAKRQNKSRK